MGLLHKLMQQAPCTDVHLSACKSELVLADCCSMCPCAHDRWRQCVPSRGAGLSCYSDVPWFCRCAGSVRIPCTCPLMMYNACGSPSCVYTSVQWYTLHDWLVSCQLYEHSDTYLNPCELHKQCNAMHVVIVSKDKRPRWLSIHFDGGA